MSEQSAEHRDEHSDGQSDGQSDDQSDNGPLSVPDEELPEDLRPSDDNPLAQPAGDDVPDDVVRDPTGDGSRGEPGADDADADDPGDQD